jgi:hypothetical protein
MKTRAPRIHLLDTELPLMNYVGVAVRCGEVLPNAEPKFMLTEALFEDELPRFTMQVCKNCYVAAARWERRYLYGLVNAAAEEAANLEESS